MLRIQEKDMWFHTIIVKNCDPKIISGNLNREVIIIFSDINYYRLITRFLTKINWVVNVDWQLLLLSLYFLSIFEQQENYAKILTFFVTYNYSNIILITRFI